MTFSKKHTAIPLSLILLCIIARGFLLYSMSIAPLTAFCKELAVESLTDNPFELHYTIAYPEQMGLKNLSTNLIPFNTQAYASNRKLWNARYEKFEKISTERLNAEETFLYHLLYRYINLQLKSLDFPYYENPLSLSGGIHSQLPILLSEYTFRGKEDVENYFLLLSQIPDYLQGISDYMKARETNGLYANKETLGEVQAQCLELFPMDQLNQGIHFLQTGFQTRIDALKESGVITAAEARDYTKRNNALLSTLVAPGYEALAASIGELTGTPDLKGLSAFPKGKEYYALLLTSATGSAKSVEEIQKILYKRYDMLYEKYSAVLAKGTYVQNWNFPIDSHSEMLTHLYQTSDTFFPSLDTLTRDATQNLRLEKVNGILADMSAPAFYMTPPIDANHEHTIYINPDAEMKSLDLYTTLAHEGFPGHLYQTVYSQTALTNAHAPLIRQLLYYGGFVEGWAVYAELYSYDFAEAVCEESLRDTILLTRYNREIQLCLCSILDIFIHYEGAGLAEVTTLFQNLGLNTTSAESVYEAICDAPANYPKYYVGYLEILELRDKAKALWGEKYSDYNFHEWLLKTGPGDFGSLTEFLK